MAGAGDPAGEPRYRRGTLINATSGPSQTAPHPFKPRGIQHSTPTSGLQSYAFALFSAVSDSLHRLERLHHPCSRSEYSSTDSSRSYNAEAPDAHPRGIGHNPSTGCRDTTHTAPIHPPCAAKRHVPQILNTSRLP